jgi:tetratricopeptide (TPR) repeat protein
MNGKGLALSDLGKYHDAITSYDKALAIDGNNILAMNGKGNALSDLGKPQDAITWYDKANANKFSLSQLVRIPNTVSL